MGFEVIFKKTLEVTYRAYIDDDEASSENEAIKLVMENKIEKEELERHVNQIDIKEVSKGGQFLIKIVNKKENII